MGDQSAGAAGGGNAPPQGAGDQNAELIATLGKVVTENVLKAMKEEQPRIFSGFLNRAKEETAKLLEERLKAIPDGDNNKGPADPGDGKNPPSAEVIALRQQLKQSDERLKAVEKENRERGEREERARVETEILKGLDAAGVILPAYKEALAARFRSEPGLKVTADGVFVQRNGEYVPILDRIKEFAGTEEGKAFLPVKGAAGLPPMGNGSPGGRPSGISADQVTPEALRDPKFLAQVSAQIADVLGIRR